MKVINLPGSREHYGEVLAGAFQELREYSRDNVISVSKVTEESPCANCCCRVMLQPACVSFPSHWIFCRFIGIACFRWLKKAALFR